MATLSYDIPFVSLGGETGSLAPHRGKVLLVVNTASRCGFTPQYAALEGLYRRFADQGLVVLGFPCDQFGNQEPGPAKQIESFCSENYQVSFPMHAKVAVNGPGTHPLFQLLKNEARGVLGSKRIKWNFTKFLVGRTGRVEGRFGSVVKPESMVPDIERLLAEASSRELTT